MDETATIDDLSDEVLERVLDCLDSVASLARAAAVSRRWFALCRRERIWCALCLRQQWWMTHRPARVPFDEIDPTECVRPPGHDRTESWRDICRDELPAARFDCVHEPEPISAICRQCGRQLPVAGQCQNGAARLGFDTMVKVVLLGNSGVGKTMFFNQFKTRLRADVWLDYRAMPATVDFCVNTCSMDGVDAKVALWDTPGFPRTPLDAGFFRAAPGYALMFDVTNRDSFEAVERRWFPHVVHHWDFTRQEDQRGDINTLVLVGIRQDLTTDRPRVVAASEAQHLAKKMARRINEPDADATQHQRVRYQEANPATGHGVYRVMATLVKPKLKHRLTVRDGGDLLHDELLQDIAPAIRKGDTRCDVM